MRTVIYTFGGTPTWGDLILISCQSARGGASSAKCVMVDPKSEHFRDPYVVPETNIRRGFAPVRDVEHIAEVLANEINGVSSEWCPGTGDFRAVAKGNKLSVMCSTVLNDVTFHCDIEGAKTETCEIEVLG